MCGVLWDFPRLRKSLAADVPLFVVAAAAVCRICLFIYLGREEDAGMY